MGKRATLIQNRKLKNNFSIINQFDDESKQKFIKVLNTDYTKLSKSECNELIKLTNDIISFGRKNIPMNVSAYEKDIIEGLRLIRLSDYSEITACIDSLIKKVASNQ